MKYDIIKVIEEAEAEEEENMCELIDFKTNTNDIVRVANIKLSHIQNIVEQVKKCSSIEALILFGSSLEERCTESSDIDIAIISKYTINKLCSVKSYNMFMDSIYKFDITQEYDKLYFHSINDIYDSKNEALIYKELRAKGKVIYRKGA